MGSEPDLLTRIREARRRLAADGPPRVRSGGDFERVSVPVSDCDVLRDLLLAEQPGTVIEIGLAYGSSALAIAEALVAAGSDEARHVVVDAFQEQFHGCGWAAITGAGLAGRCRLVEERSQIALPRLLADGFVADAAFVDGSHIFHNVFVDLFFLRELVRPSRNPCQRRPACAPSGCPRPGPNQASGASGRLAQASRDEGGANLPHYAGRSRPRSTTTGTNSSR
jgi:hypothetical protein